MENDDTTSTNRIIPALGVTATVEAITWGGLLLGIVLKRVVDVTEVGVQVFGPLHGAAFIAYCVSAVLAWRACRWSGATGSLALLASIPPFGTVVFHRWAARTGRLAAETFAPTVAKTAQMPIVGDPAAAAANTVSSRD